jgi:DNA-binding NarL/FixJ family response regulator
MSTNPAATAACRIFLVDDHALVREGLRKIIELEPDLAVCGEAEDAEQAFRDIGALKPDVAVVDLLLRKETGLDLIKRLQGLPAPPRILVLSMHDEAHYAERALRAGALGYVIKRESSRSVVSAIRQVMADRAFISASVAEQIAQRMVGARGNPAASVVERLSDRELDVFTRIGRGQENRRIAEELRVSLKTVQTHCAHIKEKLGLDNATALMLAAVRWVEAQRPEADL